MRHLVGRGPTAAALRPSLAALASSRSCGVSCVIDAPTAAAAIADVSTMVADVVPTFVSIDALGNDIFIFLAASVLVVPLSRYLNANSVLGFLALGCAIGPYGLGLFSDTEAVLAGLFNTPSRTSPALSFGPFDCGSSGDEGILMGSSLNLGQPFLLRLGLTLSDRNDNGGIFHLRDGSSWRFECLPFMCAVLLAFVVGARLFSAQ